MTSGIYKHKRKPIIERFLEKFGINPTNGCWEWTGALNQQGYGDIFDGGKTIRAHRFSYEYFNNCILPDSSTGLELDHLCRNTICVNPDHLQIVTHATNVRRGLAGKINNHLKAKTHCPQGHPYDANNTYHRPDGHRDCKICLRLRLKLWRASHVRAD